MTDPTVGTNEGWGRTPTSVGTIMNPPARSDILLDPGKPRGHLARGLGRSYADAALNSGGTLWDLRCLDRFRLDPDTGILDAEAGVSLADVIAHSIPRGWFVPVTPGTKHVTLGGALAADVHGKNHHRDGSFADHVLNADLLTAQGTVLRLEPGTEDFLATAGGMGLTGVILGLRLQMIRVPSATVLVDTHRTRDLEETLCAMTELDNSRRYAAAWIDVSDRGPLGRGVLTFGDHAPTSEGRRERIPAREPRASLPDLFPSGLVNPLTIGVFNELWWRKAPAQRAAEPQEFDRFFYPLDGIGSWNRAYGRRGFVQYQFVVPLAQRGAVGAILEHLRGGRCSSAVTVLKRLGAGTGYLSFPMQGWTVAIDIPVGTPDLATTLDRADEMVIDAGGRLYLAKDGRCAPEHLGRMYPQLDLWRKVKDRLDPCGAFQSDLSRRMRMAADA